MKQNNNYIIVGSCALSIHYHIPKYIHKDLDIFYIKGEKKPKLNDHLYLDAIIDNYSDLKVEYHAIPKKLFDKFIASESIATLETLYVLKLSHAEYNIHWEKTIKHLQIMKKRLKWIYDTEHPFEAFRPKYHDLYRELKAYWKIIHAEKKKHISLDMSKDKFFNDKVKRVYDHDFIHEIVAYEPNQPMYKKCLKDGQDVLLDENKFNALSFGQKLNLCREEIYVISLERWMIPNNFRLCEYEVYRKALKKIVTQMTKDWFPSFVCENYEYLYKPDCNYVNKFKKGLEECQKKHN